MENDLVCYICLDTLDSLLNQLLLCGCPNKYHKSCLYEWIKKENKCPICKKYIYRSYLHLDNNENIQDILDILSNIPNISNDDENLQIESPQLSSRYQRPLADQYRNMIIIGIIVNIILIGIITLTIYGIMYGIYIIINNIIK